MGKPERYSRTLRLITEKGDVNMTRKFLCVSLLLMMSMCSVSEATMLKRGKLSEQYPDAPKYEREHHQILPKKGDIGVVVDGSDTMHVSTTEAMIIQELVNRGYRVVDEQKMKKMKMAAARAQAARYAFEGNIAALLKVNGNYSAAATICAKVKAGRPVQNDLGLYTGTATISLLAVTSSGTKLGGDMAQGKAIGYTFEEAQQNAINAAVRNALSQIF